VVVGPDTFRFAGTGALDCKSTVGMAEGSAWSPGGSEERATRLWCDRVSGDAVLAGLALIDTGSDCNKKTCALAVVGGRGWANGAEAAGETVARL
jgi:hypothetical protein